MIVTTWTFASSGRFDMYTTVDATCSTPNVGSTLNEPSTCAVPEQHPGRHVRRGVADVDLPARDDYLEQLACLPGSPILEIP